MFAYTGLRIVQRLDKAKESPFRLRQATVDVVGSKEAKGNKVNEIRSA